MASTNNTDNGGDDLVKFFQEIELSKIDPFPNHPYKVKDDEDMMNLIDSISDNGLITPVVVRKKKDGRYEMISGHRRMRAYELLGYKTIPAKIVELSKSEAVIMMVESNYQRSEVSPSEKGFAYKMKLEAMDQQGRRNDLTLAPLVSKLRSNEILGKEVGESREQIRRYIRLTYLIPGLLELVDNGNMGLRPAVELSYISQDVQKQILKSIEKEQATPTHAQAIRMRRLYDAGKLSYKTIEGIMVEEKPNQKEKLSFNAGRLEKYFPKKLPINRREDYIVAALEYYGRYLVRKERDCER